MLLPRIPPATLFHLITFAILASAIDLAFTKPGFNKIAASGYPYFSVGEDVTVSWTTPWEETTVVVFQNVNGKVYYDILAGMRYLIPHTAPAPDRTFMLIYPRHQWSRQHDGDMDSIGSERQTSSGGNLPLLPPK